MEKETWMRFHVWGSRFAGILFLYLASNLAANAQTVSAQDQRAKAFQDLKTTCVADVVRFCPPADQESGLPQQQFMCLKIYRADLSLPCRKAINAVVTSSPETAGGQTGNARQQ